MPNNTVSSAIAYLFIGIWLLALVQFFIKAIKNKNAPAKTARAVVADKHIVETFSQYSGNGKRTKYVIVFDVDGEKISFYVSPFSYDGYRVGENGMLTYKGCKIIDFK